MQLGTRWAWGAEPPAKLPAAVIAAIREVEHGSSGSNELRWTLTWLEGRPVIELDPLPRTGEVMGIHYHSAEDRATITSSNSGEEWVEE